MMAFLLYGHMAETSSLSLFIKDPNPIHKGSSLTTWLPSQTPISKYYHSGHLGFNIHELWNTNIQYHRSHLKLEYIYQI